MLAAVAAALAVAAPASAGNLRAGAGRADITPPTGYFAMGWVRGDARLTGQHTRLFARVLVLERDGRKVALVAEDLGAIPGGMVADAADLVRDRGFSEQNVLSSASHTHGAPTGFYNFGTYNTVFMTQQAPTEFNTAADPQLYAFMVRRLAAAIRRADDDLAPAAAAWSSRRLLGLTENRSIEAHLNNHGIAREFGQGSVDEDPDGYAHTIDPEVNVLRVDKVGRRRTPLGMWSTFSNHGTINKYTFNYYNADHHGSATRVVEAAIRRSGRVPPRQEVVNAYGNTDEGDISSGLDRSGPAAADYVGRLEAREMLAAWRAAGKSLSRTPALDLRWTRVCFCGQDTEEGPVDSSPVVGFPLLTGSEEGRGPLFDVTQRPHEGVRNPAPSGPQGHKLPVLTSDESSTPRAVPLMALRVGDGMVVSIPGEMTAEMGRRVRESVQRTVAGAGVSRTVISGLANEYLSYFVTPEEYDRQHYEGGSQMFGRNSSLVLQGSLRDLARSLVEGRPAPEPYAFDPRNGLAADAPDFGPGAEGGAPLAQPATTQRLGHAEFAWQGGPRGLDRPLDGAFVEIRRKVGKRFMRVDSDLGLNLLWRVDSEGRHTARWEVPLGAKAGLYRFRVTANRYRMDSQPFRVVAASNLQAVAVDAGAGRVGIELRYPVPVPEQDITYRPGRAGSGRVVFTVRGRRVVASRRARRGAFSVRVPASGTVVLPAGAARDRFGNRNANALTLRP